MPQRILNIALIFVLLFSVIGVSTSRVYCASMKSTIEKKCCGKQGKENNCCKEVKETIKLSTDLYSVITAVSAPEITFFEDAFLVAFNNFMSLQDKLHRHYTYETPPLTSDISVLIQVFRI